MTSFCPGICLMCVDPRQPVSAAVIRGNLDILDALLVAGFDMNYPNKYGGSPLHVAARRGYVEVR